MTNSPQLRTWIGFAGAAVVLLSVFLPMADSGEFTQIQGNALIQHGEGWLLIVLAIAAAITAFRTIGERRSWALVIIGLIIFGLAVVYGTSDEMMTLVPASPSGVVEELQVLAGDGERASPGIGIYAAGLGGILVALAGSPFLDPQQDEVPEE